MNWWSYTTIRYATTTTYNDWTVLLIMEHKTSIHKIWSTPSCWYRLATHIVLTYMQFLRSPAIRPNWLEHTLVDCLWYNCKDWCHILSLLLLCSSITSGSTISRHRLYNCGPFVCPVNTKRMNRCTVYQNPADDYFLDIDDKWLINHDRDPVEWIRYERETDVCIH